jgi:hypothetical protein
MVRLFAWLASLSQATITEGLVPSEAAVERNAFQIFNAVHSAMRQWGSSVNHNGMSFMTVIVPEGQLLYHGCHTANRQTGVRGEGFEWLAFEVEHAEAFAALHVIRPPGHGGPPPGEGPPLAPQLPLKEAIEEQLLSRRTWSSSITFGPVTEQKPWMAADDDDHGEYFRGYLHTYRASRPLRLLYLDGMSAGKGSWGAVDTQDHLLVPLKNTNDPMMGDFGRGQGLCRLAKDAWNGTIDGFVRMEAGFEVIYCDFAEGAGLDLVSIRGTPFPNETYFSDMGDRAQFEWLRSVAQRYDGLPSGRIAMDWSSFVSVFFYDVNITNPDPERPELPRLLGVSKSDRADIRHRVGAVIGERLGKNTAVDWQGIVDLVVTRYSDRLLVLANTTAPVARGIVESLLGRFIDYADGGSTEHLVNRCAAQDLEAAMVMREYWTPEDGYIYHAIDFVSRAICSTLSRLRRHLHEIEAKGGSNMNLEMDGTANLIISELMGKLQWTTWKACSKCASFDQVCLIAMFPWGGFKDHFSPSCRSAEDLDDAPDNYWRHGRKWPPRPPS